MKKEFDFNSIINEEIHRIRNSNVFYHDFSNRLLEGDDIDNTTDEGKESTLVARERIVQLIEETIKVMKEEYSEITKIENAEPSHVELTAKVDVLIEFLKDQHKAIKNIKFNF